MLKNFHINEKNDVFGFLNQVPFHFKYLKQPRICYLIVCLFLYFALQMVDGAIHEAESTNVYF